MPPPITIDQAIVMLTAAEVADLLGIEQSTWRAYVARGQAPAPDGRFGHMNFWTPATITKYQEGRNPK
jgi:hypothetical protein